MAYTNIRQFMFTIISQASDMSELDLINFFKNAILKHSESRAAGHEGQISSPRTSTQRIVKISSSEALELPKGIIFYFFL